MVREIRLTPPLPKCLSKRRKVDTECRVFQEKWTQYYLFTEVNTKPVCLVCNQQVSVLKEYNIRRHYETHHEEKYHHLQGQLRKEKINELLTGLKKQQSAFTRIREVSDAAVKASYLIANELVQASKPFSDGEFVKTCMLKAAEVVCPEKRPAFANISLSRNTVADRVEDLSGDLGGQMNDKIKSFIAISVAVDESTDVTDVAQLAIFIRGVDETLTITEEFLELVPMKDTTTANDIFSSLIRMLDKAGVDWSRAVSLATDGAPSMVGGKAGVATKFREKVQATDGGQDFWTFHCILHQEALCCKTLKMDHVMSVVVQTVNFIRARGLNHRQFDCFLSGNDIPAGLPYHTEVRWLSRGAVLKRFFELREEIGQFMEKMGNPVKELKCLEWVQGLAFMVDITQHLNNLNKMLQGRKKVVTQYYENIRSFKLKLSLWETQLSNGDTSHFPCLTAVHVTGLNADLDQYKDKITGLLQEFERRFQIFSELENEFAFFRSPFTVKASDMPADIQLEVIDLQCDSSMKQKFASVGLDTFYQYLLPGYPKLTSLAAKILSMFGTTYLCEQAFSVMNLNKTKHRSG
ncbi:general transcription factor II-I repeat domain-containing protein 2-like [Macrobrachium rosenbergii]|uniref:general transcription factor II-I repeat domain-containing protein 2-like n=1 Tax=Macrobrachium rosenbergii TaxID=79674 RepID=UPI0034D4DE4D